MFKYVSDQEQRGKRDHWALPEELLDIAGELRDDCDGFALYCRGRLKDRYGYKGRLLLCKTETGGMHLVLEYKGFILDNRRKYVDSYPQVDYEYIKISGEDPGDEWREVISSPPRFDI